MGRSPQRCAETMADGMDIVDIVDSKNGLTPSQTNQMFYHFSKVLVYNKNNSNSATTGAITKLPIFIPLMGQFTHQTYGLGR